MQTHFLLNMSIYNNETPRSYSSSFITIADGRHAYHTKATSTHCVRSSVWCRPQRSRSVGGAQRLSASLSVSCMACKKMSFSEGGLDVKVTDEELGEFLAGLFDENENDEHGVHIQRSREVVVHGEVKRLRLSEYVTADLFDDIETTLANIGASGGVTGDGVLLKNTSTESIETALFKILTFPDIAKWTLLKNWIDTIDITLDDWLTLWKKVDSSRHGKTASHIECTTVFRFTGTCGKKICLVKTCKDVADAFHDSIHNFGYVTSPHRGTKGLMEFEFPGSASVAAARKKLCLLLHGKDRVAFCHDQISGKLIDINGCLQIIRSASPDDVALPIAPLGGMDGVFLEEDEVAIKVEDDLSTEDAKISTEPPLKKLCSETTRSREGSRTEEYLREEAEKAKDEAKAAEEKAKAAEQEAQQLREQLAALKVARETPQEEADIGIKIEEDSDDDSDSVTSAERERYFREFDEEQERYEQARDEREIEQFGMEIHQKMKRRRLSQYDATHIGAFLEFRNTYRTMREKRDLQIELRVWLPVFLFAGYFAATEYGAEYLHEQDILPALRSVYRGSSELLIYIGIFLCAGIMLVIFALSNPTVCDWFYGLVITPATRLCFASNQGYASMLIIVLLCSQKIKWLLALEFVGVVVFVVMAPLANRFIFMARLLLTLVFYQNRLINHLDQRTPTIFLSVWRELILTLMFVVHFVYDKLELFFCGCGGYE